MVSDLAKLLMTPVMERVEVVKNWQQRLPEVSDLFHDFDVLWREGRQQDFKYWAALEIVLRDLGQNDQKISESLTQLRSKKTFISFFQCYFNDIKSAHRGQREAKARVCRVRPPHIDEALKHVESARSPARRTLLDATYGYLIAKAIQAVNEKYEVFNERHVLTEARRLLEEEGAATAEDSRFFSDETRKILSEAQRFLDGELKYSRSLGLRPDSPPERVVIEVEEYRKTTRRYPAETKRFVLYLRGEHPRQKEIEQLSQRLRLPIRKLTDWLSMRAEHPHVFRVASDRITR